MLGPPLLWACEKQAAPASAADGRLVQQYSTGRLDQWAQVLADESLPAAAKVDQLLEQDEALWLAAQRLMAILQIDEARADTIVALYENGSPILHLRLERKVTVCGREARHCGADQGLWQQVKRDGSETHRLCETCSVLEHEFAETRRAKTLTLSGDERQFVRAAAQSAAAGAPDGVDPAVFLLRETQRALYQVMAARVVELGQEWLVDRWLRRPLAMRQWLKRAYGEGRPLIAAADVVSALESSPALLLRLFDGLGPTWQHTPLFDDVVPWLIVNRWPALIDPLSQWATSPHGREPLVQTLYERVRVLSAS